MADVIIIGAGPAGLSAAIYVQRAGKNALLLEAMTFGGQIVNTPEVENYPGIKSISGFDFAMALYEQATGLGAEIVFEKAVRIEKVQTDSAFVPEASAEAVAADGADPAAGVTQAGESAAGATADVSQGVPLWRVITAGGNAYEAKAVILATGAKNRKLGIEREDALTGMGVSYCATCDGAFYRGKAVAVNGGGNTALEDALFLSNACSKVYVVHRREGFRGEPKTLEALRARDNVEFVLNATVTRLITTADQAVQGEDAATMAPDHLVAVEVTDKVTGESRELAVEGLFIAIGQEPENQGFGDVVTLDGAGYITAGEDCLTGAAGIFVAGDCRTKTVRQLATAAADGAVAALAACTYLG